MVVNMEMVNCRSDFGASFPNWLVSSRGLRHELDNVVLDACLMEKVESRLVIMWVFLLVIAVVNL